MRFKLLSQDVDVVVGRMGVGDSVGGVGGWDDLSGLGVDVGGSGSSCWRQKSQEGHGMFAGCWRWTSAEYGRAGGEFT